MEKAASISDTSSVVLRDVIASDLPTFFEHQLDPEANWMAAFTTKDPTNKDAFMAHWTRILADEANTNQTILFDGQVVGHVSSYRNEHGQLEVTYWIGRTDWGKGIASKALSLFLDYIKVRPLYARAAQDNIGSLRVLEKCGFTRIGENEDFANARRTEIKEYILRLD
ncbi:MAG TPA: GNAT family N-acetyltransferase [Ktedonobacteraceae bacterium]